MDLGEVERFGAQALRAWGLAEQGWTFRINPRPRRRLGQCDYARRQIEVSREYAIRNDRADIEDTILHEVAHALAGIGTGHGPEWRRWCRIVGAEPKALKRSGTFVPAPGKVAVRCSSCKKTLHRRHRRPTARYLRTRASVCCRARLDVVVDPQGILQES